MAADTPAPLGAPEVRELPPLLGLYSAWEWFVNDHGNGGHASDCEPAIEGDCHCGFDNLRAVIEGLTKPALREVEAALPVPNSPLAHPTDASLQSAEPVDADRDKGAAIAEPLGCCAVSVSGHDHFPRGITWYVDWLPKGYGPTAQDKFVCALHDDGWSEAGYGLRRESLPPLIRAVVDAIEAHKGASPSPGVELSDEEIGAMLPEPAYGQATVIFAVSPHRVDIYTAKQMRQFARAVLSASRGRQ